MQTTSEIEPWQLSSSKPLTFREDVINGLSKVKKTIPCKYFYDKRGSALFDRICELPEYYPTRTEAAIMHDHVAEMASKIGMAGMLVEYGSGSSTKTRILLNHLQDLPMYVPVDISDSHLNTTAEDLRRSYPRLEVYPVSADYTRPFDLPPSKHGSSTRVVYFPGSTIGNFHPVESVAMLGSMAELCGPNGGLLIGIDLKKDLSILEPAYNDAAGVTAEFNKNLLHRINNELGGNFEPRNFTHFAFFNEALARIEMHLVSERDQEVWIGQTMLNFVAGETIWTESSYKYTLDGFAELAKEAGWQINTVWTDSNHWFSVQYWTAA